MKPSVTIKVTPKVVCLLRFVAAMRREKQYHILDISFAVSGVSENAGIGGLC
jgi:hypothetical protein